MARTAATQALDSQSKNVRPAQRARVPSVDALRGLVMIIMALDHTRDFFHAAAQSFQPEDLTRTTALIFFTRWITHFCAPVFMFTAGMGAFLWLRPGRTTGDLSRFLWTRGVWLIFLDQVVLRFGMFFSFTTGPVILNVLWALGWSMVALAILVHLPIRVLAACSIAMIVVHNLADPIQAKTFGRAAWLWDILHQQALFKAGSVSIISAYPLIPWIAVMALGFWAGGIVRMNAPDRQSLLLRLGAGLTVAFIAIRLLNVYGDPRPWSPQSTPLRTLLSFLNCTKYPPSLEFLLMTLGPAMLVWVWFDRMSLSRSNPLIVFGRVPLFYFIIHFYLIHALAVLLGGPVYNLGVVYLVWAGVVAALYAPCLYFSRLKEQRRDWWLSYL